MSKRVVVLESPYAGNVERNTAYARKALRHSVELGEAPLAGHLLYTQILDDLQPGDRELGIACHLTLIARADAVVVYTDLGVSRGMQAAIDEADSLGVPIERRAIGSAA